MTALTFQISDPLLQGSGLRFAYEYDPQTWRLRERLCRTTDNALGLKACLKFTKDGLSERLSRLDEALRWRILCGRPLGQAAANLDQERRAIRAQIDLIDSFKYEKGAKPTIPIDWHECRKGALGIYLPVGTPIHAIAVRRDAQQGIIPYRISSYDYAGHRVIYYQAVTACETAPQESFRIASDWLLEGGQIEVPSMASRCELFWQSGAAEARLAQLGA
jgi:hypothetical protein